jgi:hypothetical protein
MKSNEEIIDRINDFLSEEFEVSPDKITPGSKSQGDA